MACLAILFLTFVLIASQRLMLAAKFLIFGTNILSALPKLLLVPFLYTIALVLVLLWGLAVSVSIFDAGSIVSKVESLAVNQTSSLDHGMARGIHI
jgi:hypothetical protein